MAECVLLCFINPRVRKIRNEASSCPGIFSRNLRFYYVASHLFSNFGVFNLSKKSTTSSLTNTKDTQISTYTQTHSEGPCRGGSGRIPIHVCGEGGSGENQGEKEWCEGDYYYADRRERENGKKQT